MDESLSSAPLAPRMRSHLGEVALEVHDRSLADWGSQRAVCMVGRDGRFLELQTKLAKMARFEEPVLVVGESGVGKESLAAALYLLGDRRGKPFVPVSCPQYREGNLTVSELFGHKRGSFTGATADRKGCFETAAGGVIFLDEVGDLHMSAQVMLLRALSAGEFQPLGSDTKRRVDARVVAATNRPMSSDHIGDHFRNDLFFRLRYFLLEVPPLRERGDDWRLLADFFLADLFRRHGVRKHLSAGAESLLARYSWPGNVRELKSVVTTGYAMAEGVAIQPPDIRALLGHPAADSDDGIARRLHQRLAEGQGSFWSEVRQPFLRRDLNRAQVRELLRHGLEASGGSYRRLLALYRMRAADYQKLMDFLRHHRLKPQ